MLTAANHELRRERLNRQHAHKNRAFKTTNTHPNHNYIAKTNNPEQTEERNEKCTSAQTFVLNSTNMIPMRHRHVKCTHAVGRTMHLQSIETNARQCLNNTRPWTNLRKLHTRLTHEHELSEPVQNATQHTETSNRFGKANFLLNRLWNTNNWLWNTNSALNYFWKTESTLNQLWQRNSTSNWFCATHSILNRLYTTHSTLNLLCKTNRFLNRLRRQIQH